MEQLAADFAAIAACVEERRPDRALLELLTETQGSCERAAAQERLAERRRLLANVTKVVETWQRVWPRLGRQREFRQAVAREARLWAKRLGDTIPL